MNKWIGALMLMIFSFQLSAAIEIYQFEHKQQEVLYSQLIDELRCLVCQNQNLSASNSALAKDLRHQTYQMVMEGQSQAQIMDYMTQRYGDFVLYRPPVKSSTVLLWLGPFILLLVGVWLLVSTLRKEKQQQGEQLSDEQHTHINKLLNSGDE